jgi:hypothetical protein
MIQLIADYGFEAEVDDADWPHVGGAAKVTRNGRAYPGRVVGFRPTYRLRFEWKLQSGEMRDMVRYGDGFNVGDTLPIQGPRFTWQSTCVEKSEATIVPIEYTIQSGAVRRADFFYTKAVGAFFVLKDDGGADLCVLRRDAAS